MIYKRKKTVNINIKVNLNLEMNPKTLTVFAVPGQVKISLLMCSDNYHYRSRVTALHAMVPGFIPDRVEIFNFSLGLELGRMMEQNFTH